MNDDVLRYCRQVVLKTMDWARARMRGSDRLLLREAVTGSEEKKAQENLTKGVDREAEELIIRSLLKKLPKVGNFERLAVVSEEVGILTFPKGLPPEEAEFVAFIDPIDGTEFIESLQGGWSLLAIYDRGQDRVATAVGGDIFLDRLYWASQSEPAECLDFVTHSWFKLDGGPNPKKSLREKGIRVNMLTTKVGRFRAAAAQQALFDALEKVDGRINLAWGSNMIIQVAAGYADAAVEFAKGFAAYDVLPGLFIGERAGLTILDLNGKPLTSRIDVDEVFAAYRKDSKKPKRIPFVVAKEENLAREIVGLLKR